MERCTILSKEQEHSPRVIFKISLTNNLVQISIIICSRASFTRKGYQLNMDKSDVSHFVELACSEIHTHNLVKDSIPHVMELRDA